MSLLVFLDIDGCLRRESAPKYRVEKDLVERLELWIREQEKEHGSVEIVITSSWRDAFSLEEIRQNFKSAYLWLRINSVTPTLTGDRSFPRYDEIVAYLKSLNMLDGDFEPCPCGATDPHYVIIDDQPTLFPPGLDNAIFCDPSEGFNP
jgi:hypothetical protein